MKKILIFRHSSLGDFIVGIRAITMVKKKFFNHKIYYLTAGHSAPGAVNPHPIFSNNKLIVLSETTFDVNEFKLNIYKVNIFKYEKLKNQTKSESEILFFEKKIKEINTIIEILS